MRHIKVDLDSQTLKAIESDGTVRHEFPCVTGDASHPTDKGTFRVLRKHKKYTSKTYKVPMNYALFFTADGKAIHQYHGPGNLKLARWFKRAGIGAIGSHGCVRLTEANARTIFEWAAVGTIVSVL